MAPRWPKMRFVAHLGLHLDGYWGASWRQDGPRWRQVGQLGAKMCPRLPTWSLRWPTWRTFGSILATFFAYWARSCQKLQKPKKRRQYNTFEGFLESRGCSWRPCRLILAPCWVMLAPARPSVGLSLAILALMLGHLDGKLGSEAPRWRPRGPGGASMGGLEAPRREVPRGVGGNRAAFGPYPHSKDPQILILQASNLEDFNP